MKGRLLCCTVCALLVSALVALLPAAVMYLLWRDSQPPSGSQARWVHKLLPDWGGSLVRGLPTNSPITDRRMDFLEENFTHHPKDVWVVTYQKTGTTWMQYTVLQILGYPKIGSLFDLWRIHSPWPEVAHSIIASSEEYLQRSEYASADGYRCFKSHWPRQNFLTKLPAASKIIYVMRRAESVAISYWHHIYTYYLYYYIEPGGMSWDQYFEKFIHGDLENGDYFEHVASFWKVRDDPNVLIVRYEDMKGDMASAVRRVAGFLGVTLNDAQVAEILEATSLKAMKRWSEGPLDKFLRWIGATRGEHIRSGNEGAKENLVTASNHKKLVARYDAVLKPLGVPFEYMFEPMNE